MWKSRSSESSSRNAALIATIASVATSFATLALCYAWHQQQRLRNELLEWERKRQEERTGRIRAEVKLRKALKQQQHASNNNNNNNKDEHAMKLTTIGTIVSPYTKRMGTPRQGALVPSSRGFVQFSNSLSLPKPSMGLTNTVICGLFLDFMPIPPWPHRKRQRCDHHEVEASKSVNWRPDPRIDPMHWDYLWSPWTGGNPPPDACTFRPWIW
jgi:hypothetical protein